MSAFLIAAAAGLLVPQTPPGPSSLEPYTAPVIRPFEPGPEFGRETAQGDVAARPHRRPLTAAVTVDAYDRSYEAAPTDLEIAYDQGVASAEIRADQTGGPLDRDWRVRDAQGRLLYSLVLADSGSGAVEGGWRAGRHIGGAAVVDGVLQLDDGAEITLERTAAGWRGQLTVDGRSRPVTLTRPD